MFSEGHFNTGGQAEDPLKPTAMGTEDSPRATGADGGFWPGTDEVLPVDPRTEALFPDEDSQKASPSSFANPVETAATNDEPLASNPVQPAAAPVLGDPTLGDVFNDWADDAHAPAEDWGSEEGGQPSTEERSLFDDTTGPVSGSEPGTSATDGDYTWPEAETPPTDDDEVDGQRKVSPFDDLADPVSEPDPKGGDHTRPGDGEPAPATPADPDDGYDTWPEADALSADDDDADAGSREPSPFDEPAGDPDRVLLDDTDGDEPQEESPFDDDDPVDDRADIVDTIDNEEEDVAAGTAEDDDLDDEDYDDTGTRRPPELYGGSETERTEDYKRLIRDEFLSGDGTPPSLQDDNLAAARTYRAPSAEGPRLRSRRFVIEQPPSILHPIRRRQYRRRTGA